MKLSLNQIESLLHVTNHSHDKKYVHAECPVCGHPEFWLLFQEDNQPCGCSRGKKCGWRGNIFTLLKLLNRSREFLSEREIDVYEKLESSLFNNQEAELVFDLPEIKPPSTVWVFKRKEVWVAR